MLSLLAAVAMNAAAHCGYDGETRVTGLARDPQTGELAYCEYHLPAEKDRTRVLYYSPQGYRIAEKTLISGGGEPVRNDPRPEVLQRDYRQGEERQVRRRGNRWEMRYRAPGASAWDTAALEGGAVDVIDAGFDAFVRRHWDTLVSGQPLAFDFASPVHGRAIELRARRAACRDSRSGRLCFRVDLAQPLLRFFAGDLYLEYGADSRRLLSFEGVVNLLDSRAESQQLRIDYRYE